MAGIRTFRRHRRSRGGLKRLLWITGTFLLLGAAGASWWWDGPQREATAIVPCEGGCGERDVPSSVRVRLPEDDAPHQSEMEWWYYNGHLRSREGKEFSFHYVFFLVDSIVSYTVAQVSLTDHQTGKRYTEQKESPGNPSAGTAGAFRFTLGDWVMAGSGGNDTLRVAAPQFSFDWTLTNSGPTVYQGGIGWLDFGQAGDSYYYSRPRLNLEGQLSLGGKTFQVTGQSWFDHQWGDFQAADLGWDWFALQLDDGADIMLYQLRDRRGQPVLYSGTYTRDGVTDVLGERDFSTEALGSFRSRTTGESYRTSWRVRIPSRQIDLRIAPVAADSEIDGRTTTRNTYWEGAVSLSGSHSGKGFLEINPAGPRKPGSESRP